MKACLVRLGIRNFKPTLRQASERLETLRTGEGAPLPANTVTELRRDMARLRLVRDQIKEIEAARMRRLNQKPEDRPHAMVRLLARVIGVGIETADMAGARDPLATPQGSQGGCASRWPHGRAR